METRCNLWGFFTIILVNKKIQSRRRRPPSFVFIEALLLCCVLDHKCALMSQLVNYELRVSSSETLIQEALVNCDIVIFETAKRLYIHTYNILNISFALCLHS